MTDKPAGPLTGLKVVEFAGIGPSPHVAMLLADMGARWCGSNGRGQGSGTLSLNAPATARKST